MCFCGKALPFNKVGCTSEIKIYALFGISKYTVYRLIRKGAISHVNLGTNQIRVSKQEQQQKKVMDISKAKKISIVDYLEKKGYTHVKIRRGQYWYRSPLREEKTPSFVVNNNLLEWYDFGIAEGSDLIELGKRMYNTNDIHTVKRC